MRFRFAGILLIATLQPALSQTITVRSGEHANFSRLVFEFPDLHDWNLGITEESYVLTFSGPKTAFDLSRAFDLIPRTRISGIDPIGSGNGVEIFIACDPCHAVPFEIGDTVLVVDVVDGPGESEPEINDTAESEVSTPVEEERPTAEADPQATEEDVDPEILAALGEEIGRQTSSASGETFRRYETALDLLPSTFNGTQDRREVGAEISRDLQRAAGLPVSSDVRVSAESQDVVSETLEQEPENEPDPIEVVRNLRIRAEPGAEDLIAEVPSPAGSPLPQCPESGDLDISAWGDDENFASSLGTLRREIVDARDRPSPDAISRLAMFYVYLTFGSEALGLTEAFPDAIADGPLIRALATAMDWPRSPYDAGLAKWSDCGPGYALWALMTTSPTEIGGDYPKEQALIGLSDLPLHIRRHLGPEIARRFESIGMSEAANAALASVTRAPGNHGPEIELAEAVMMPSSKMADLDALEVSPPDTAARALLELTRRRAEMGERISEEDLLTLSSFSFEFSGTELGANLKKAEVEAWLSQGRYLKAIELAVDANDKGTQHEIDVPDVAHRALETLTKEGSDVEFLLVAKRLVDHLPRDETAADTRARASSRAYSLGFADLGFALAPQSGANSAESRLSRARHLIAFGDPDQAREVITGLPAASTSLISAEILSAQGSHAAAARAFAALGALDRAATEATLSGDPVLMKRFSIAPVAEFDTTQLEDRSLEQRPVLALELSRNLRNAIRGFSGGTADPQED